MYYNEDKSNWREVHARDPWMIQVLMIAGAHGRTFEYAEAIAWRNALFEAYDGGKRLGHDQYPYRPGNEAEYERLKVLNKLPLG